MIQWAGSNIHENTFDARGLCHQNPNEDCIWETPGSASLGELTTAADNQQVKGFKDSKRCHQESQLAEHCPRQSNRRIVCRSKPAEKSTFARSSLFCSGGLVANIPCVSSNGMRCYPVLFHGVVRIHRKSCYSGFGPTLCDIAYN